MLLNFEIPRMTANIKQCVKKTKKLHNENIIPRKEKKITKILLRSYSTSSMGANLKPKCEKRKNAPQIYNQEKIHALDAED